MSIHLKRFLSRTIHSSLINDANRKRCVDTLLSKPRLSKSYRNSAVLVPFCMVNDKLSLFYTVRTHHLPTHKGQVSFPGGKVDEGDDKNPVRTALRETREEVGMFEKDFDVWGTMYRIPARHGMVIHPVIGVYKNTLNLETLEVNHDEVADIFTVSIEDLTRYAHYTIWRERKMALPVYKCPGKAKIWGFTAMVTHLTLKLVAPEVYNFELPY